MVSITPTNLFHPQHKNSLPFVEEFKRFGEPWMVVSKTMTEYNGTNNVGNSIAKFCLKSNRIQYFLVHAANLKSLSQFYTKNSLLCQ